MTTLIETHLQNRASPSARSRREAGKVPILGLDDDAYVVIEKFDEIPPFFSSLTSDSNLWLFVSSTGSLTAGRGEADQAILPYETVDKIHDNGAHTGPVTVLRWQENGTWVYWEPFKGQSDESVQRRLMKNLIGSRMVFEETLLREGLVFSATLMISDRFGLVRECMVRNSGPASRQVEVLHGIRNLVPSGVTRRLQGEMSCLTDAYKQNEILEPAGPGTFTMASGLTDQPVPCESLRATVAWSCGLPNAVRSVDLGAITRFMRGEVISSAPASRGVRAHYLEWAELDLKAKEEIKWIMVADTALDQRSVAGIKQLLETGLPIRDVHTDIALGEMNLRRRLAAADGFQGSGDPVATSHHLANVLFNVMRGGIFPNGYEINRDDFAAFLTTSNRKLSQLHSAWLATLPSTLRRDGFHEEVRGRACPHLERIFLEYLPLAFSRRHGDPSRPWNHFKIQTRDGNGNEMLFFQGNWRDIFQNWEALALSFPEYLESMISKFVNASTVDGYNPYRLTRDGIDWEEPEPDDPWASFGYWGDHQIIYLLKLLEAFEQHEPGALTALLSENRFTYANVPYRIKPLEAVLRDPRNTLTCDSALSKRLIARAALDGSDAKLICGSEDMPVLVTLMEKLLVPILAKWSNFIPGGGIWMNSQRPEWNDANNALVGNGLSMVTLNYLRRHQAFIKQLISASSKTVYSISSPVVEWLDSIQHILVKGDPVADAGDSRRRREILFALGEAGDTYRKLAYSERFTVEKSHLSATRIGDFFSLLMEWTDATIRGNQRPDGLFHSYNLMRMEDDGVQIRFLDPMLEGQVAVLSAQVLTPAESVELLNALRQSDLYCPRRRSFLLYPDREFTPFLEKNRINAEAGRGSKLLSAMLKRHDDRIVRPESEAVWRFHPDLRNADCLGERLKAIAEEGTYGTLPSEEGPLIADLYESVFEHHAFTGRSGSMFAYEGLGSIYWHMVSKLLLAVQENLARASFDNDDDTLLQQLDEHYDAIRDGLGYRKTAVEYGAFPTDPYSHTPAHAGAQQPGMTGQVKEEILTRRGEFGIWVRGGRVCFAPIHGCFQRELTEEEGAFHTFDLNGMAEALPMPAGSVAYTLCQTPIICSRAADNKTIIRVHFREREPQFVYGNTLSREDSLSIFRREGRIHFLEVHFAHGLRARQTGAGQRLMWS
jgi:hypothetical protein